MTKFVIFMHLTDFSLFNCPPLKVWHGKKKQGTRRGALESQRGAASDIGCLILT